MAASLRDAELGLGETKPRAGQNSALGLVGRLANMVALYKLSSPIHIRRLRDWPRPCENRVSYQTNAIPWPY